MKSIIFNAEMVRAILDGRKTQTRRVIKTDFIGIIKGRVVDGHQTWVTLDTRDPNHGRLIRCGYGQVGDTLWVRETWARLCSDVDCSCEDGTHHYYEYKADSEDPYPGQWPIEEAMGNPDAPKWRPSIHMPKDACRLFLSITDVRVERLQDISRKDIDAEGTPALQQTVYKNDNFQRRKDFMALWNSINAKRGYGWGTNPRVWVIEFEEILKHRRPGLRYA